MDRRAAEGALSFTQREHVVGRETAEQKGKGVEVGGESRNLQRSGCSSLANGVHRTGERPLTCFNRPTIDHLSVCPAYCQYFFFTWKYVCKQDLQAGTTWPKVARWTSLQAPVPL